MGSHSALPTSSSSSSSSSSSAPRRTRDTVFWVLVLTVCIGALVLMLNMMYTLQCPTTPAGGGAHAGAAGVGAGSSPEALHGIASNFFAARGAGGQGGAGGGLGALGGVGLSAAQQKEETFRSALDKRLLEAERDVASHAMLLERFLARAEAQLRLREQHAVAELKQTAEQDAAVQTVMELAKYPAPPMPEFELPEPYKEDANSLGDLVDRSLISWSKSWLGGEGNAAEAPPGYEGSEAESLAAAGEFAVAENEEDRMAECRDMQFTYQVQIGVSWGSLPSDLQRIWRASDCDALLSGL